MKTLNPIILAGDIGGSKTRLGLFRATKNNFHLFQEKNYLSGKYSRLEIIVKDFLRGRNDIDFACFGIAGPVTSGIIRTTNLPWTINSTSLQRELSLRKLKIINDLVANAYGICVLKKDDFMTLNRGRIKEGNRALISAGTGLGEAILFWNGKRHVPSPSEGGHVDFGPTSSLEVEMLQYLMARFGHVSYETILSGSGLFRIFQFLKEAGRFGKEPAWLSYEFKQKKDPAAVISEVARLKKNRLCSKALDIFSSIYGAAAGNLALLAMTVGGIYIGGGISPKIIWKLKEGTFIDAFKKKGRLTNIVSQIPVKVIMNEDTALLGAAFHARDILCEMTNSH